MPDTTNRSSTASSASERGESLTPSIDAMAETQHAQPPTLVQLIRNIEQTPDYVFHDKPGAMRTVFDYWANRQLLVRRVVGKETTFSTEYEELFHHRNGVGMLYPHLPPTEFQQTTGHAQQNYEERVKDAYAALGGEGEYESANFVNAATGAGFGVIGGSVVAGLAWLIDWVSGFRKVEKQESMKIDRRRFLGEIVGGTGLTFGALGGLCSLINYSSTKSVQQNAVYLDKKIEEAYR